MHRDNTAALLGAVLLLMLLPFVPGYVSDALHNHRTINEASAAELPTDTTKVIGAGYVGSYGISAVPTTLKPQVLGVSYTNGPSLYQAQEVNRSNAILELDPGQSVTVWIDFLNNGTTTWYGNGEHFAAVNLTNPTDRSSIFQHDFWPYPYRAGRLIQDEVRPGETGRFRIALHAPDTTGIYTERFHLVLENEAWIDGGYFDWIIGVGQSVSRPAEYQAREVERSHGGTLSLDPGQAITFWIDFENTGLKNWYNTSQHFVALNVAQPIGRVSPFQHQYWNEYYYRPGRLLQDRIYRGETGRFRFALQAPSVEGYYTETFSLVAENLMFIPGATFTIKFKVGNPVTVSAGAAAAVEPRVRVGLYSTADAVTVQPSAPYIVANVTDGTTTTMAGGQPFTIPHSPSAHWRIEPSDSNAITTITSFEQRPAWNTKLNDNSFRGVIEIRATSTTKEMWVINELPLEYYLRGVAEVSNEQPREYLKTMMVSARSYALWHVLRGGKHPETFFDIDATTDQVYRGYGFEQRSIDPLAAVQTTSGVVVTHPQAVSATNPFGVAVTAYSSGTDGRTRSWNEVWSGSSFPWLVSVEDPYGFISNYASLVGNHMVGLSATGARGYAVTENRTFDWILKHYYTGSTIKKIY